MTCSSPDCVPSEWPTEVYQPATSPPSQRFSRFRSLSLYSARKARPAGFLCYSYNVWNLVPPSLCLSPAAVMWASSLLTPPRDDESQRSESRYVLETPASGWWWCARGRPAAGCRVRKLSSERARRLGKERPFITPDPPFFSLLLLLFLSPSSVFSSFQVPIQRRRRYYTSLYTLDIPTTAQHTTPLTWSPSSTTTARPAPSAAPPSLVTARTAVLAVL